MLAKLKVELDGNQVAQIRDNESIQLPVAAGPHEIRVTLRWASGPTATLKVDDDETVKRKVEIVGNPLRAFYARGNYFRLV
jgi:hypothetical protein